MVGSQRSALALMLAFPLLACSPPARVETPTEHQDLLTGCDLLADVLADESQLDALVLLKKLTLRAPVEEVDAVAQKLTDASKRHAEELEALRELEPRVTGEPAVRSPVGDAITALAKEAGTEELLDRGLSFSLRFVLLQAQATRMVAAMASALAEADPNAERRAWLEALATEYEGLREELVEILALYLRGEGAAQQAS